MPPPSSASSGSFSGRTLSDLGGDLAARIRPHLGEPLDHIPVAVRCRLGYAAPALRRACCIARPSGGLVIELERAGPPVDLAPQIERGLRADPRLPARCGPCATRPRASSRSSTGYDRVMVYRFDERRPWRGLRRASASRISSPFSATATRPPTSRRSPGASTSATGCGSWSMSTTRRCRCGRGCRRSPAATSTCPCASCAACRRSTSST